MLLSPRVIPSERSESRDLKNMIGYIKYLKKIFSIAKKVFLVITVYFVVISLFMYFFNKDRPKVTYDPIQNNRQEIYKVINDKKLNSTKEGKLSITIYRSILCGVIGEGCTNNSKDGQTNYKNSLSGFITELITLPYVNPPASGIFWAKNGLENAGFIPKTQAAGIGFNSLSVFMPIWKAMRNLSYLILVLIIIIIGFMIMFRMKLNPQTITSVENALPKIIVTLILITFSYAIAGFMIDLMYLIILAGIEIIGVPFGLDIASYQKDILTSNIFGYIFTGKNIGIYFRSVFGIIRILPWEIQAILGSIWTALTFILAIRFITPLGPYLAGLFGKLEAMLTVFGAGVTINIGEWAAYFIAGIVAVIVAFAVLLIIIFAITLFTLLFLAFRIAFLLLSSLIQLILYIMLAPLIIMTEAIPGQSSFSSWIKNIIGNLIVFPSVIFLIMICNGITQLYSVNAAVFTPPFLANWYPQTIAPIISAVILLMIPDLVQGLKQAIIGKGGLQIPASPAVLFGAAGTTLSTVASGASQIYYLNAAKTALFGAGKGQPGLLGNIFGGFKDNIKKGS